jgi:sec-independent protein translocase protein TatA
MGMPGGFELFAIVAVVVLLFGGKKIPELAKGLGQGIKNFKSAVKDDEVEVASTKTSEKIENSDSEVAKTASATETKTV